MFKKLKQKIDEQSPQRNDQSPQQAKKGEPQSLAQKLQQRVSSVESVFWGSSLPEQPLHSSSRESLVHSPSWESLSSLGQNEVLGSPSFDPPSDIESEVEDVPGSAEGLSKEHLLNCLHRMEKRLTDYKGKYSEMVIAYRSIQRDKEKMQVVLSQSQDKALRRIGELKEELQMDQEAKKHLQAEFDSSLEEKDQIISVLQTQVALMKKRFKSSSGALDLPDGEASKTTCDPEMISDLQPHLDSPENNAGGSYVPGSTVVLEKQLRGQDALLENCEKLVGTSKEESSRLSNENEALQEQLQERLQELEKMKELHTTEKTKLITQLRDAKNLIEQLEQDKGMVIAQTKRQMHDTLEMKEEEILQLRSRMQQTLAEKEELQEQWEKAEKAASEELERALGVGQRSEDGRRELQARMEEQLRTMQDCDEERRNLEQELTRVKQEMENIQKRNLELDSCLAEYSQKEASQSDCLSKEIEEQTRKFEAEIAAIEEKCTQEMERLKMELTDSLNQQHAAAVFILQQQHSIEIEAVKKEDETQLHAHVEEMNQKMLAELNAKQTEMEGLSSMLIEVRKSKQQLEEKLGDMEAATDSVKQELQVRLSEEEAIYHAKFADINNQHKETLEQVKTLNEELNHIKTTLQEKNKELEEHIVIRRMLEENAEKTQLNVKAQFKEIEDLRHITQTQNEDLSKSKTQISFLKNELKQSKVRLKDLENHLEESRKECQHKAHSLEQKANENEELHQRVKQAMNDLSEKENALEETCKTIHDQRMWFKTQLEKVKCLYERNGECLIKEVDGKLKSQEVVIEKVKRKTEEMQGNLTKKLKEHEVNSKLEEAKKEMEFEQKDQQIYLKALELAQESTHKNLQENEQKLREMSQQLLISREDKELLVQKVKDLGEEVAMRETTAQKLQVELNHAVVKLEQKSEEEKMLKKEVEFVENNLNKALNEKTLLQEQLHNSEESSRQRVLALSKELEETQKKLKALEICSESEKAAQLQKNENLLQMQIGAINRELEQHCQGAQAVVNHFSDDICSKVDAKISGLQNRLLSNQKKAFCLKNVIFTKNDQIGTLQKELQETVKESRNLKCSLDDIALLLNVYSENLKTVTSEKESLQKPTEDHSQVLSIEIPHREKLGHESRNISKKPKTDVLHVSNLESFVNDLKAQLATSLTESTEAISLLKRQHSQEKHSLRCFMEETVEKGEKEKKLAGEQVDMLRNQLSEVKTQTESTILALQNKIEDMERQIADKDEALQRLATSIDGQQSEREQLSSLTIEIDNCTRRINELENQLDLQIKEREHLVAELQQHQSEKTVFIQQLQQAREECSLKSDLYHKAENKLRSLQTDIEKANQEMEFQQREFQKEHTDILKAKEDALKAAECSTGKLSDLKKKAEHKIGLIRKHLTSQIEEKERTIRDLQVQLKDISQRQNEDRTKLSEHNERLEGENAFAILKDARQEKLTCLCDDEKTISRIADLKTDPNQSPEEYTSHDTESVAEPNTVHNEASEKYTSHKTERTCPKAELSYLGLQDETNTREMTAIKGNDNDIKQATSLLEVQPISAGVIKGRTTNENQEDWESEKDRLVKEYEMKLTELSRRLEDKNERLKDQENIRNELCDPDDGRCTDGSEEVKFADVDSKRQKIHKDYVQLEKELLSLRKEHEKDLEYLRKEIMEENEKKQKLEVEDMEMKHNFALKQLMREYNAQMSLKEKELEESIKEAFEKAQCVEAELMESHREEISQMKQNIAQKDEELNRTVQRYEQVLQSREEEMSNRVCEIKKELEDLQQRSRNSPQGLEEIQTQLAKKTTLLSEARLREQESQDRIHELEDKIQTTYKNLVVTHLGSKSREPSYYSSDLTEFEYLRKVMFEYMMGRETKTMAKVITSMLKFPADQTQKVLEREDSRVMPWLR